jgi:hypothetical protein
MNSKIFLTAAAMALIAGCGSDASCSFVGCGAGTPVGGGTGGTGGVTLDQDNALTVLREAWYAANTTSELPFFVAGTGIGDTSGGVAAAGGGVSKTLPGNSVLMTPFGPTVYNCPVSGTFTVSGDVADMNTITAGDFSTYVSSACDSGTGYTVDGTHTLDIASVTGDVASGLFEQAQAMTFTNFQAATAVAITTLNGDHTVVLDTRDINNITTAFSGTALDVVEDQIAVSVRNFSGFATTQLAAPFNTSLAAAGRVNSSVISGSFDFSTSETIQQLIGEFPSDGIFDVHGDNFSTARIVVVDANFIHLQVDANGSQNYEFAINNMTWEEFLGLAP